MSEQLAKESGDDLVIERPPEKDAIVHLPNVCAKCGTDEGLRRLPWTVEWVPAFARLIPLAAVFMAQRLRLHLALCAPCHGRWLAGMIPALLALPISVAGAVMVIASVRGNEAWLARGLLCLLAAALWGRLVRYSLRDRQVWARRVDGRFVTVAGFGADARKAIVEGARHSGVR